MDLKERLRLLRAAGSSRAQSSPLAHPAAAPHTAAVKNQAGLSQAAGPFSTPIPAVAGGALKGFLRTTPCGETFYLETRYPGEYCRGPLPLKVIHGIPGTAWALLGRVPPSVEMQRAVFLDTETTGLAGGSGTYAFLVGLGFFQGTDFVVRQYFLRDYPEEDALLEAVGMDLKPCQVLVTFNGKSYDWPLLETRFRLSRRTPPLAGVPHLDLLHPARRIWRDRLPQCSLTTLESHILGVVRQGDVPGSLIPQRYFDYLHTGDAGPLAEVAEHNRMDILSLVSLATWLGRILTDPFSPTDDGELLCGDDLFALGRLYLSRGSFPEGIRCLEVARERGLLTVSEARLQRELSTAYKRVREHQKALVLWQEMAQGSGSLTLYPYLEMAKYYEHVAHNYQAAYQAAQQALSIAQRRRSMAGASADGPRRDIEEVRHRLDRLERKLAHRQVPPDIL